MNTKDNFTKVLAVTGTVLVWLPLLTPLIFSLIALVVTGILRFDYLMPAELFPLTAAGGVLLVWAALRARSRSRLIAWGLVVAIVSLAGSQLLAVVTGLASGETPVGGWEWLLVLALLAVYILADGIIGVGGALLWRDLFGLDRPGGGR